LVDYFFFRKAIKRTARNRKRKRKRKRLQSQKISSSGIIQKEVQELFRRRYMVQKNKYPTKSQVYP